MAKNNGGLLSGIGAAILVLIAAFPQVAITIAIVIIAIIIFNIIINHKEINQNAKKDIYTTSGIQSFSDDLSLYEGLNTDFDKGIIALNNEDYNSAINYFTLAMNRLGMVPKDDIYVMRGIAYSKNGDEINALNDFNMAIKLFAFDNPTAYLERGKIYLRQEKYNLALDDFNTAISMDYTSQKNADYYFYRGMLYIKTNRMDEAMQDLNYAISIAPATNADTINNCRFLLQKIQNMPPKNSNISTKSIKNNNSVVNLNKCSKKQLLTLQGFDEKKVDEFLEKRANGQMWYDLDSFVKEFEIQPHEMIMIQNRLKFPPKPRIKSGKRKLDI